MPRRSKKKDGDTMIQVSSGNVFADLELDDAKQLRARADLAAALVTVLEARDSTQAETAKILGIDQPGVSNLVRGQLDRFSCERLMRFLVALDQDVEIRVRPRTGTRASIRVLTPQN